MSCVSTNSIRCKNGCLEAGRRLFQLMAESMFWYLLFALVGCTRRRETSALPPGLLQEIKNNGRLEEFRGLMSRKSKKEKSRKFYMNYVPAATLR
jgi:hypothetical protein